MLYLVYGSESDRARAKKDSLVSSCKKQRPEAEFFVLNNENFSESVLESLYSQAGLFERKLIVVIDRLLVGKKTKKESASAEGYGVTKEDDDEEEEIKGNTSKDILIKAFPKMASSESVFILFDEILDTKTLMQIKKHAKNIFVFGEKKIAKAKDDSVFSIVEAYAAKDRKSSWVNYQKCLRSGVASEAIHGLMFWRIKSILLAKKTGVYNKFSNNFTIDELDILLLELNVLYHGIRQEGGEMEILLEKFILSGK